MAAAPEGPLGVRPGAGSWGQRVLEQAARVVGLARGRFPSRNEPSPVVRSAVACAAETIALVLDDAAPVPETQRDVQDLLLRLRGHLMQLGAQGPQTGPWAQALGQARQLAEQAPPVDDFLKSRVHLRKLAAQLQTMLAEMRGPQTVPGPLGSGQEVAAVSLPNHPLGSSIAATAARRQQ
ncbi:DUF6415 family natural product biosynthesis protein [Streptomyces sp. NPDC056304]|uniref:DUF6415 family natural product biosynthesis protein n=1 Tax=Streptomyces sp. NPDC056304 TaxID=3345778 RepID=UPI0035D8C066